MPVTVKEFKDAFLRDAKERNEGLRWGAPEKFWQTQTELKDVSTALDDLERAGPDELEAKIKGVRDAIAAVDPKKRTKYDEALTNLEAELNQFDTLKDVKRAMDALAAAKPAARGP